MAELRAEPRDLDEVVSAARRSLLAAQASYVVVPVLLAGALFPWSTLGASFVAGLGVAWGCSLGRALVSLRSEYLSQLAWLLEPLSVSLDADGFGLRGSRGETYTRWNDELAVRELRTCYLFEDEGAPYLVLPRRFLSAEEIDLLRTRLTEP